MSFEKELFDMKLGEVMNKDLVGGLVKAPSKLVKIAYTLQSIDGTQLTVALKDDDYIENEEEEKPNQKTVKQNE